MYEKLHVFQYKLKFSHVQKEIFTDLCHPYCLRSRISMDTRVSSQPDAEWQSRHLGGRRSRRGRVEFNDRRYRYSPRRDPAKRARAALARPPGA